MLVVLRNVLGLSDLKIGLIPLYSFQTLPIQAQNPIYMEDYALSLVGDKAVFHGGRDKQGNIKSSTYILNLSVNVENPPPQQGVGLFNRAPPRQRTFSLKIQKETKFVEALVIEEIQAGLERSPGMRNKRLFLNIL